MVGAFAPDDVIAALAPVLDPARRQRLDAVAAARLGGVVALLEDLRDPHNAGAALRSCEAMGLLDVHVVALRHPFRTAVRVTQGCEKWLRLHRHGDVAGAVAAVKGAGLRLFAAVPGARRMIGDLDFEIPTALAFGNEHLGLSPELLSLADGEFGIPMHGCSQSLNVSVSVAVALHVASENRRRRLRRSGDLAADELLALRARYYALDLREPEKIVEHYLRRRRAGATEGQ